MRVGILHPSPGKGIDMIDMPIKEQIPNEQGQKKNSLSKDASP
jgi:hypothetical protein